MADFNIPQWRIVESKIEGIKLTDNGKTAQLDLVSFEGEKATLTLHDVDRIRIDQFREQNIVESIAHWNEHFPQDGLREVAFDLITGRMEGECTDGQKIVVAEFVKAVMDGEREAIAISGVYGAEMLASFGFMRFVRQSDGRRPDSAAP